MASTNRFDVSFILLKSITFLTGILFLSFQSFASDVRTDSSVRVSFSKDEFQFGFNSKESRVEINEAKRSTYLTSTYEATVPVTVYYNNETLLNSVNCKVDGKTPSDFKPYNGYYTVSNIFHTDEKVCYFSVHLKNPVSRAEVAVDQTYIDPRYFTNISFLGAVPISKKVITIKIPRWMSVEIKELNFGFLGIKKTIIYLKNEDADLITYTADNLPAAELEQNSPGPTYLHPHLLILCKGAVYNNQKFNYFNTLNDLYLWYHGLTLETSDLGSVSTQAKEITAPFKTDLEKVKAVFFWVQNNIRYIAFEDGVAGFKPAKSDEVLRKRYADCKGMANLTKGFLTALGYNAKLCWLGTNHIAYDYSTPSLAVDNHMICALNLSGKTYFLDATETYIGLNEYAERIQGRQVLIENGESFILSNVPKVSASQNADIESEQLSVVGNDFQGKVSHIWKGEDKEDVLSGLNGIKKESAEEAFLQFLAGHDENYQINNLTTSDLTNQGQDLSTAYNLIYKNAVSNFDKSYYITFDKRKEFSDQIIDIRKRQYDYWFPHSFNIIRERQVTIPDHYQASEIPAGLNISNSDYEFHIEYAVKKNIIVYKKSMLIKNTHLTKANFARWNRDIEQLNEAYSQTVILKPIQ